MPLWAKIGLDHGRPAGSKFRRRSREVRPRYLAVFAKKLAKVSIFETIIKLGMKADACYPHEVGENHRGRPPFYYLAIVISLVTLALSVIPILAIRQSGGRREVA